MRKSAEILKYVINLMGSFNLQNKMRAIDSYGQRKTHVKFGANWRKFSQAFHESFNEEDEVERVLRGQLRHHGFMSKGKGVTKTCLEHSMCPIEQEGERGTRSKGWNRPYCLYDITCAECRGASWKRTGIQA